MVDARELIVRLAEAAPAEALEDNRVVLVNGAWHAGKSTRPGWRCGGSLP